MKEFCESGSFASPFVTPSPALTSPFISTIWLICLYYGKQRLCVDCGQLVYTFFLLSFSFESGGPLPSIDSVHMVYGKTSYEYSLSPHQYWTWFNKVVGLTCDFVTETQTGQPFILDAVRGWPFFLSVQSYCTLPPCWMTQWCCRLAGNWKPPESCASHCKYPHQGGPGAVELQHRDGRAGRAERVCLVPRIHDIRSREFEIFINVLAVAIKEGLFSASRVLGQSTMETVEEVVVCTNDVDNEWPSSQLWREQTA